MQDYRYTHGDRPLDGYTIQYALGRGGFGEVYFGISDAGREVALKVVQNYEEIELRGINHCMNLKSRYLVTVFDVKQEPDGRPWVIMEYVSGPSLREVLDEAIDAKGRPHGIGADQTMYFTRELIKGMRDLHDAGVVHRDLKPHNVFFEDGTVKIGDYSLSKAISNSHRSNHTTTVGSVHYMAPEIGEGNYGKGVDIYALGAMMYEMLTGSPPYTGESMGEVLIKHLTSTPDVSKIAEPFASAITKSMQRNPENRFQSVDEMLLSLCPEDHSSYLPAPASLSMIGQQAVRQRAKRVSGQAAALATPPSADPRTAETATNSLELVDTQEEIRPGDKRSSNADAGEFDSQPFERPGLPWGSESLRVFEADSVLARKLNNAGLHWKRGDVPKGGKDPIPLYWRIFQAAAASFGILYVGSKMFDTYGGHNLSFVEVPLIGGLLCWIFLQTLPRGDTLWESIIARLIGAVSFLVAGLWLTSVGFENDMVFQLFLIGAIFDWRCFIAVNRYPRVGQLRTFASAVLPGLLTLWIGQHMFVYMPMSQIVCSISMVVAVVLTIQILAPLLQVAPPDDQQSGLPNRGASEPGDRGKESQMRFSTDSFTLMEKV